MSARFWLFRIMIPLWGVTVTIVGVALLLRLFMNAGWLRLCATIAVCEILFVPFTWFVLFDTSEQEYLAKRICSFFNK